ncbi:MAG: CDP-diacylglycerol--glycerol-3-phosphate 3-phosphatidyltransferase [Acidobacteriota bacterium]|jgi:CDP-diacylglycerol--glycerol-3-phosphate 3-phosphatidyltransferase|nr:CDP-diacylglycerol--glycerol-3-phosphate 3-phosphatidyltransferase [Acidobacteriota bacterium]
MNLPNALTIGRIFLVPVVVTVLLVGDLSDRTRWGASLFLAAALTDLLDGYLARRRKQVTTLGRLLDPIADKLLISSALIALVQRNVNPAPLLGDIAAHAWWGGTIAPAWAVVIIIGREFAVSGLRSIAAHEGFSIDVSLLGKGKMVMQVAAVFGLILGDRYGGWVAATARILLGVVVVFALVSMVQYFREFWRKLDDRVKMRETRRIKVLARRKQRVAERKELGRLRRLEELRQRQAEAAPQPPLGSSE